MKNIFKVLLVFIFAVILFPLLTSCGSSASENFDSGGAVEGDNNVVIDTTRKIYYTVRYRIEADDFASIKKEIYDKVSSLEGYVQTSSDSDGYAEYVYRVPTKDLNVFLDFVDQYGDSVESKTVNSTDVTTEYSEIEARREVLQASRQAYLAILNSGDLSMSEIISIQDKITEIDIETSFIEKELAQYDNLLDYSSVIIHYSEKELEVGFFDEYGSYLAGLFGGIGKVIMYLLPFILGAGVIALGVFGGIKIKKMKDEKKK